MKEMLAGYIFELKVTEVTEEHGEMSGSLKIPAGGKLGSAIAIAAMHDGQFSCAFVSHF